MKESYNRRQLLALAFVFAMAPVTRLLPRYSAKLSGSSAWLGPLIALPFLILFIMYISAFMDRRQAGEGLAETVLRSVGGTAGSIVLFLVAAFALFYCGFIVRSGADRYISTIYPAGGPLPFVLVMFAIGLLATLGPAKAFVRAAKLFAPLLITVLALVLLFSLATLKPANLLPLTGGGIPETLLGAVPVLNILFGTLTYAAFLEGPCPREQRRGAAWSGWALIICGFLALYTAAIIGNYGALLTENLSHPFFTMIRDVTIFRTIERIEAFVVALWVYPDFIVLCTMLTLGSKCLRLSFGFRPQEEEKKFFDMKNGRWLIPAGAVIAAAVALLLPKDALVMEKLSELYVPAANFAVTLVILPLCFLAGALRKRSS